MPPLLLDDEEAIAIAVGLRTAARASVTGIEETAVRALVKLEQVLADSPSPSRPAPWARRPSLPAVRGPTVDPQHLTVIAAACRDSERLRFAYRSREGTDSRREVEPHSLVNLGRRWYLVAWDRRREDWRTFRRRSARASGVERRSGSRRARCRLRMRPPTSSRASRGRRTATRPGSRSTPPPTRSPARVPAYWGTIEEIDAHAASSEPATTTSDGSRCGSRCSASTSRSTSPRAGRAPAPPGE